MSTEIDLIATNTNKVDNLAATAYLAHLAPVGRQGMATAVRLVVRAMTGGKTTDYTSVNWATLNAANVQAIISRIAEMPTHFEKPRSPASVAMTLNALKGIAKAAWQRETISTDTWERIRAVQAPRGERLPTGRDISQRERKELLQTCIEDPSSAGRRNAAILAMLMATGIRRAELVGLTMGCLNLDTGEARIIGKGNKERVVYVLNGAKEALEDWLSVRGLDAGYVFNPINKAGTIHIDKGMTTTALHLILQRRADAAQVQDVTAHDFRRTLAGDLLDSSADMVTVSKLLGHADPKTTARYDRRGERAKLQAAQAVNVPYRRIKQQ